MSGFFNNNIEQTIIAGCRNNDAGAQSQLFEAYSTPVFTLAFRLTACRAVADEVVQDTFLEVLTKIEQFRGDAPIGAWIRRIAVNKALAHLRSPWHKRGETLLPETIQAVDIDDSVPLDLESSLRLLSPTARTVLWLHEVEGYTHKEIAALVDKTVSFSKSQLSRAHQRLNVWASAELARANARPTQSSRQTLESSPSCTPLLNN